MGVQAEAFLTDAGDAFYERNRDKPRFPDPVLDIIADLKLQPKSVLEVGCGDGWRLEAIRDRYDSKLAGLDASRRACCRARQRGISVYGANITDLRSYVGHIDLIIFGFCLYVIDRESLFEIVAETSSILDEGGHIIIHDFFPEYPYRRPYAHKKGLWSYKMDYSKLWLAHPGYKLVRTDLFGEDDNRIGVAVLQKDFASAFPARDI